MTARASSGWKASEKPGSFTVKDGMLVVNGPRSHLYYNGPVRRHNFQNFEFRADVMTTKGSNSGIYFHTQFQPDNWPDKGFECQVNTTHNDPKKTGGLYNVKDVMNDAPSKDGEWFNYYIKVEGKHVIIKIDGKTTVDWTQPDNWTMGRTQDRSGHHRHSGPRSQEPRLLQEHRDPAAGPDQGRGRHGRS